MDKTKLYKIPKYYNLKYPELLPSRRHNILNFIESNHLCHPMPLA